MTFGLNQRAWQRLEQQHSDRARLRIHRSPPGESTGTVWDFGVENRGGLSAGLLLSRICLADLASVQLTTSALNASWQEVIVQTDQPLAACLLSQYAGWQISLGEYFGMGSGPFRSVAAREELFDEFDYRETPEQVIGVLEAEALPGAEVFADLAEKLRIPVSRITLVVAPTASIAGTMQIVARSVETALHKLHEIGFDVRRVLSGFGAAPLPPVGKNFLSALGLTNDAILYGGRVTLWVTGDDDSLAEIGPRVPSSSSAAHGEPFKEIFQAAGHDFYKIDPLLFSPAEITLHNVDSGRSFRFGHCEVDLLKRSFAS